MDERSNRRSLFRVAWVALLVVATFGLVEFVGAIALHTLKKAEKQELPRELLGTVFLGERSPETVPDPYVLYKVKPNQRSQSFETNSLGFRGPPVEEKPSPDTYRILLLGGSVAWGYSSLSNEDTIAHRLQGYLNERRACCAALRGMVVEVVNGGVPGYVSWQEVLAYSVYHRKLRPRMIVILDGANDYYASIKLGDVGLPMRFDVTRKSYLRPKPTFTSAVGGWLAHRFHRLQLRRYLARRRRATLEELQPPSAERVAAAYRDALLHLSAMAGADGVQVVPVLQPLAVIPDTKTLTRFEEEIVRIHDRKMPGINAAYVAVYDELWKVMTALGAAQPQLAPLDARRAFADEPGPTYVDYCHLTPRGRELLSAFIGAWLFEQLDPS